MRVEKINSGIQRKQNLQNNQTRPTFQRNWSEHISWGANYLKETGKTNFKLFSFPDAKAVFVEVGKNISEGFGAIRDRVVQILATAGTALTVKNVLPNDDKSSVYPMDNKGDGVYEKTDVDAKPGMPYRYIVVDKDNNINLVKDPYAKKQEDINGWSTIYDADNYKWENTDWLEGKDPRRIVRKPKESLRGLDKLIIDEVNIPTLTKEGTFESAKKRIDIIADRGVATAIELMPVENTFSKQWGYDGVDKFAVNEKLGGAEQLKSLIDYAHGKGLNVIMDMVPNHMGPDGDYLKQTGPYEAGDGQFGAKLNYEGQDNRYVRDWMVNAALWWANEFKVDGIRFDMTKETASDYLLKQLVEELNEHNPQVFTIAEDGRNNKLSVTRYDDSENSHENKLDFIDMNIEFIHSRNWKSTPHAIGFDSEWDFPFMHTLKDAIINNSRASLNRIDELMYGSLNRVKYVMSHDEIGNEDGTRLIHKIIAQKLNIFHNINGIDDADKGQKAAQLSQKLVEYIVANDDINEDEFQNLQRQYGVVNTYSSNDVKTVFKTALAKQRLAQGTIMTIPGPKMYFQGDDNAELGHFKFFREFTNDRKARQEDSNIEKQNIREKGYDMFLDNALPDSILGRIKPVGEFKDIESQMVSFNKDIRKLIEDYPVLSNGKLDYLYKDFDKLVHVHGVKDQNNDIVIFKNFDDKFYNGNFSTLGFPKEGTWVEIFNSDDKKYGGSGLINEHNKEFSGVSQNFSMAANSIVVMKRVN